MAKFVEMLMKKNLISGNPVVEDEIKMAESKLDVKFARDYKDYVKKYGFVCFDGHELTGICKAKRLDVVSVTEKEREYFENIPKDAYVIEQAHIDGIVIWQTSNGKIYQSQGNSFEKICDSLAEYIGL